MGSPLSPVVANIFMANFEEQAIDKSTYKPKLWLRYVDDTFVIWPHGKELLDAFLAHLNSQHRDIKFTMEVESKKQIPFLDILIQKKEGGRIGHTVYRKPTHTNRYLQATSHHHPAQLNSVVKSLVKRSQILADQENQASEIELVSTALQRNGFGKRSILKALKNKKSERIKEEDPASTKTTLPFIKGTTDKIGRILRRRNIQVVYKPHEQMTKYLRKEKDKIPLEAQGVYQIPCSTCEKVYVGQTNRRISVRLEEHKNAVLKKVTTSALVQHIQETKHEIAFNNTKILANEEHSRRRIIREAIEIERRINMNARDDSQRLPNSWKTTLAPLNRINTQKEKVANTQKGAIRVPDNKSAAGTKESPASMTSRPVTRSYSKIYNQTTRSQP